MILDLESVFNTEGLVKDFDFELDLSQEELSGLKPFTTPVRVIGSVGNHTGVVELNAVAEPVLELNCDRCAKPITVPLQIKIFHTLVTHLNDETNDELLLINELRFDVGALVTEDIFLELPAKFLCSEDCKGVCPKCGKDLNTGSCSCSKETDPRLDVLKQLLDN